MRREASAEHLSSLAQEHTNFKAIYDHWLAFRKASNKFFSTAELAYGKFAYQAG